MANPVQLRDKPAELILQCSCTAHYLKLYLDEKGMLDISRYINEYYAKDSATTIWRRIKLAFTILFGKAIECQEVVLDTPEIQKMRDFLNERVTWKKEQRHG